MTTVVRVVHEVSSFNRTGLQDGSAGLSEERFAVILMEISYSTQRFHVVGTSLNLSSLRNSIFNVVVWETTLTFKCVIEAKPMPTL